MGNLLCIRVHAANIHDTKGGVYTFEKALYRYPAIQAGCADGGYRGTFQNTFDEFHNIRIDISMQIKEQKGFLEQRIHLMSLSFLETGLNLNLEKAEKIQRMDSFYVVQTMRQHQDVILVLLIPRILIFILFMRKAKKLMTAFTILKMYLLENI